MNPSISKLSGISGKKTRRIVGLMSGTSLDGLDIALCDVTGSGTDTSVDLVRFDTISYDRNTREALSEITSVEQAELEKVCIMNARLGELHAQMILDTLDKWSIKPLDVDCIASHGQTIFHAPKSKHGVNDLPNATLQIGDGDHIASKTGILTISDFRQKHTAVGGEGAPMAGLVDEILFRHAHENRILLNIGGIANLTLLPAGKGNHRPAMTTDTGPGNTLIDAAVRKYFARNYDKDGEIAQSGKVDRTLLNKLKEHPFFKRSIPKTTGPELFNLAWVLEILSANQIAIPEPEDLIATLTRLTAETIAEAIHNLEHDDDNIQVYVSGGGVHNKLLMKWLKEHLPGYWIQNFKKLGLDPDAKEAVLFAVLANETLAGEGFRLENHSKQLQKVNFGKISFPK
ncbi:anhydro-N-acetylmuramic acid kinase [Balneolaceae bacterium YR4-1]|uniref:Anhydro-N-acetylmuramic acid kinase n=1 Tax=Halalkalibaculum roseum TaxID=2709311 RepID=A0A6M1T3W1_9BACT|nr:anhydro-N-acetylmuramic acid kinase [Halalkalibaculum roseum]NGP77427.1 anhydro-N-acetylmuramic acid kinase [Halalkalibaculum roseum]